MVNNPSKGLLPNLVRARAVACRRRPASRRAGLQGNRRAAKPELIGTVCALNPTAIDGSPVKERANTRWFCVIAPHRSLVAPKVPADGANRLLHLNPRLLPSASSPYWNYWSDNVASAETGAGAGSVPTAAGPQSDRSSDRYAISFRRQFLVVTICLLAVNLMIACSRATSNARSSIMR
jgi:hypothetical protein